MSKPNYHHGDLKNALIEAGLALLAQEGIEGLSLRKVAQQAGVSHTAPYAHYADKQALIAALATAGYRRVHEALCAARERYPTEPVRQLVEGAWAYVDFARQEPSHFKLTFSGLVEREQDYPDLVAVAQQTFGTVVEIVTACQAVGALKPGPVELLAVSVWGTVHGVAALLQEGQISHTILERFSLREILLFTLGQMVAADLTALGSG